MPRKYSWFGYFVVWLLLVPVYLAFASNVGYRELAVSAAAAAIATFAAIVYARQKRARFQLKPAWLLEAPRVAVALFTDTCLLLGQAARRLSGRRLSSSVVSVAFDCGEGRASDAGRRALAVTFLTLTPNTVVLDVCPGDPQLTYHELVAQPLPGFARRLGAEP